MAKIANSVEQTGAFPTGSPEHGSQMGLTKREYFAATVLNAVLIGSKIKPDELGYSRTIKEVLEFVDEFILELEK